MFSSEHWTDVHQAQWLVLEKAIGEDGGGPRPPALATGTADGNPAAASSKNRRKLFPGDPPLWFIDAHPIPDVGELPTSDKAVTNCQRQPSTRSETHTNNRSPDVDIKLPVLRTRVFWSWPARGDVSPWDISDSEAKAARSSVRRL